MTLSEIETILGELAARHQNLDEELLDTLLLSAGWEEKSIKEALVLFKNPQSRKKIFATKVFSPAPIIITTVVEQEVTTAVIPLEKKEESTTFYQTDGTEEGKLNTYQDIPKVKQEQPPLVPQKIDIVETKDTIQGTDILPASSITLPETREEPKKDADAGLLIIKKEEYTEPGVTDKETLIPLTDIQTTKSALFLEDEEQSLIVQDEIPVKRDFEKHVEIPNNLPLLPYESSPHIWSFSHYKNVFHKDIELKEEIKVITVMPKEEAHLPVQSVKKTIYVKPNLEVIKVEEEEISSKKVPMTKGDESLVFLAGVMLLVIILILGYMYSNGRL
jgi:hypothetical protein